MTSPVSNENSFEKWDELVYPIELEYWLNDKPYGLITRFEKPPEGPGAYGIEGYFVKKLPGTKAEEDNYPYDPEKLDVWSTEIYVPPHKRKSSFGCHGWFLNRPVIIEYQSNQLGDRDDDI